MLIEKKIFDNYSSPICSHINVGTGEDLSIKELAVMIKEVVGFKGDIIFDKSKPDGSPRKLLNIKKIKDIGFSPKTTLNDGLKKTYLDYLKL